MVNGITNGWKEDHLRGFINRIDGELGRDSGSLDRFEWIVEDRFHTQIQDSIEWFSERPDLLNIQKEDIEWELEYLLKWFEEREEYEKCARIVKVKDTIEYNIKKLL
jgi:hypothetical protein